MRTACLLLFALSLSACSPAPNWHKEGVDENTLQADLSACRKQAQAMHGSAGAAIGSSPLGPRFGPVEASPADRMMQEAQSVNACMRAKGYVLKAAEKQ